MSREPLSPIEQACAIPYRLSAGRVEVCLVTTIKKRRWIFPKGIIKPGETASQAALNEAWEEAGLRGHISGNAIGSYELKKCGLRFLVNCFLMQVSRQSSRWREAALRERAWLPLDEALASIGHDGQRSVLAAVGKLMTRRKRRAG